MPVPIRLPLRHHSPRRRFIAGCAAAGLVLGGVVASGSPAHAAVVLSQLATIGGSAGSNAVAVSPDKSTVYVTNPVTNTLSVIDATTNMLATNLPTGASPFGVAVTPDGGRVYVANFSGNSVSVVDAATRTVVQTIAVGAGPMRLAASPDGGSVYVPNTSSNSVSRIDVATGAVVATVGVGGFPRAVAVSPDNSRVYVVNLSTNDVSVISTATDTVIATIGVGINPDSIAISPDGSRVYTVNRLSHNLSVIDTATGSVTGTIGMGVNPFDIAASPDGTTLYVTHIGENNLKVVDLATSTVATVALSGHGRGVAVNADSTRLYVTYSVQNVTRVFGITPVPTVTAVSPGSGPASGGNPVTITGTNLANVTGVTFGPGNPATGVSCTATACSVTAPPGGIGVVDVQVAIGAVTSAVTPAGRYTYVATPPVITAVRPDTGPPAGGNAVTISGTDLGGASILFGTRPATGVSCTATSCTVTAPAGDIGTVSVRATTSGGVSPISPASRYTYAASDLAVALTATGVPGLLRGRIDYTITVTNNGPSTLTSATINAPLPSPMLATGPDCATSGGTVTCAIAGLASGASVTRRFSVAVGLLAIGQPYPVTATRTASAPGDTNAGNDSATRTCIAVTSLIISCR